MEISQLQELYQRIPNNHQCPRDCSVCCGPIPVSQLEIDLIKTKYGVIIGVDDNLTCNCLKNNLCSVYEDRPLICRLFNETKYGTLYCMECENNHTISDEVTNDILEDYLELAGQLKVTHSELQGQFSI